jgi:nucleotide-binding universal stress UspA family protein
MTTKILVPLDGSPLAEQVLAQVRRVLRREDAEVVLLQVVPDDAGALAVGRTYLERLREELRAQGAQAVSRVVTGDPAAKILEVAQELSVSLIAMSTHGRSGLSRAVRGSVAERVLRHASRPLLLVTPRVKPEGELAIRRILVPLDGSERSAEVLPIATSLAKLYGAELILFYSIELAVMLDPIVSATPLITEAEATGLLEIHRRRVTGVPTRTRVAMGPAAQMILEVASQEHVDLIAMTTHGRSGISRWFYGSTAEQVTRHTSIPLLIKRSVATPASRTVTAPRESVTNP